MPESLRISINYENLSEKWCKSVPNYSKQYCNIYLMRLQQMTGFLEERIRQKWGDAYPVCKLHKLSEEKYPKCVVVGTLFKNQKLKPSILKQLAEGNQLTPQPIVTHFTDKSDELYIEDELQRYFLMGLECDKLVTGISCALLGTNDDKGRFQVEDYIFVNYRPQVPRPHIINDIFIVFLSGLDLIKSANSAINLQLFVYWLNGFIGDLNIHPSKVVRVIIAGNSVRSTPEVEKPSISMLSRRPDSTQSCEIVKLLDEFLFKISQTIDVDVMPGENDPTNHILPQKPMHFCMFPKASIYKTVNQVSNPYCCSIDGVKILGTSGQPIHDIMKFSEISDPLEALENCLEWGHLAPTAPDTLGCFPFYDSDPFIIEECPHVLFAGNQKEFATKECTGKDGQKVVLISIPEFAKTFQACVLNLKTFTCRPITFQAFQ